MYGDYLENCGENCDCKVVLIQLYGIIVVHLSTVVFTVFVENQGN